MKALFLGLSVATVMGLLAGGAMKPVTTDFQGGPQSLAPVSGHRAQRVFDETASWTSYGGDIPDYVIGADWIAPDMSAAAALDPEPEPPAPAAKKPERIVVEIAQVEEPPAPPPNYPSTGGDILAGMGSYSPPVPPQNVAPAPPPAN
jgi:hypothetical protein